PLTEHGKIDRAALPLQDFGRPAAPRHAATPLTAVEEIIAGVWQAVLQRDGFDRHSNFFDAGGHSLLATQVAVRLEAALHFELPVATLFDAPTIGQLASVIEQQRQRQSHGTMAPPLVPVRRGQPLPLSFAQQRLWFLDQLQPGSGLYSGTDAIH